MTKKKDRKELNKKILEFNHRNKKSTVSKKEELKKQKLKY